MKLWAQIKNSVVVNIIVLEDETLLSIFVEGYDDIIRIDQLETQPKIGSSYSDGEFVTDDCAEAGKFNFVSNPSVGGNKTEQLTFPGLLEGDQVIDLNQMSPGTNNKAITGFDSACSGDGVLGVTWSFDPGEGAIVNILIKR